MHFTVAFLIDNFKESVLDRENLYAHLDWLFSRIEDPEISKEEQKRSAREIAEIYRIVFRAMKILKKQPADILRSFHIITGYLAERNVTPIAYLEITDSELRRDFTEDEWRLINILLNKSDLMEEECNFQGITHDLPDHQLIDVGNSPSEARKYFLENLRGHTW